MADDHEKLLTGSIRQSLGDKSAEKRRQAAAELEANVKSLFATFREPSPLYGAGYGMVGSASLGGGSRDMAPTLAYAHELVALAVKGLAVEFCDCAYPSRRKGGLLGLASMVIALEHTYVKDHTEKIVQPILVCFCDEDSSVRLAACEAFYNFAKVARRYIRPHLHDIFDGLCRLYADVDNGVKEGAQCVDRLVKDIVTEFRDFDYPSFVPALFTRIQVLNPSVLQLILDWIELLDSVPQVDMIVYLPQYLESLFKILRSENRDIRHKAEVFLNGMLMEIKTAAAESAPRAQRAISDASPIVARCCHAGERHHEDNYMRLSALIWLEEFVQLQCRIDMPVGFPEEPESSPRPDEAPLPGQTTARAALRHFRASSDSSRFGGGGSSSNGLSVAAAGGNNATVAAAGASSSVSAVGTRADAAGSAGAHRVPAGGLKQLVPVLLKGALHCLDDVEGEIREKAESANAHLRGAAQCLREDLPVEAVVEAMLEAMRDGGGVRERSPAVLLKCFGWAQLLITQCPRRVLQPCVRDKLLEAALAALAPKSKDEVAVAALRLIAQLVTPGDVAAADGSEEFCDEVGPEDDLFARTCHRIFRLMAEDEDSTALGGRCELVVRKLCEGADVHGQAPGNGVAERFFTMAARAVAAETDKQSARRFVRVLNRVLLTSRETRGLRARLRDDALAAPRPGGERSTVNGRGEVPAELVELLRSWFHCPISTLALCLWLHWFELAAEVTARLTRMDLSTEKEMTRELKSLIQLLESPIFVRVRLQLLNTQRRPVLLRTVLGLVALLPQEPALRARLDIVETGLYLDRALHGWGGPAAQRRAAVPAAAAPSAAATAKETIQWLFGKPTTTATTETPERSNEDTVLLGPGGLNGALALFDAISDAHGFRVCVL